MFCTSCGTKNVAESNFCKQCGSKQEKLSASRINPEDFERALPDEEQMSALLEHAYALRKEGNYEGAIALCLEALHLPTESTSAHSLLGQIYEERGDRAAAIREYERVLLLNPGSIADRVKLDELRSEDVPGSRKAHPRIVLSDQRKAPVLDATRFTAVGITVVLVLLGGLIVLQLRPSTERTTSLVSTGSAAQSGLTAGGNATQLNSMSPLASAANSSSSQGKALSATTGIQPGMQTPVNAASGRQTNMPSPGFAANSTSRPSPPILYQYVPILPSPASSTNSSSANGSSVNSSNSSSVNKPKSKRARNGGSDGNATGHVMLPDNADVVDSSGKITVPVGDRDFAGRSEDKRGGDGNPRIIAKMEVDNKRPGAGPTAPSQPTSDARTLIAMGEDKKNQHEYKAAIEAYTHALANAGDQAGFVFQQRALCFQNLNDLTSAKSDFSRAIEEYHKLESADPETARNGIRVCEHGIKTCSN